MKRLQCLDRGQGGVMLIYTLLIGNSRMLHLKHLCRDQTTWEGEEPRPGSVSMAPLLALFLRTGTKEMCVCMWTCRMSQQN